jgi:hypothetical protein
VGEPRRIAAADVGGQFAEGKPGQIKAKSGSSVLKNRWAAEIGIEPEALNGGTLAVTRLDMLGKQALRAPK